MLGEMVTTSVTKRTQETETRHLSVNDSHSIHWGEVEGHRPGVSGPS